MAPAQDDMQIDEAFHIFRNWVIVKQICTQK